jgi:hypothetical protein
MTGIEWGRMTPEETIRTIEDPVNLSHENKYALQVGLKDLDFDINEDILKTLGMPLPFQNIDQAEMALRNNAIQPTQFIEDDNTEHLVLSFDHRPVGFSGFMGCATHSLALTSHGLFEVGRYPAVSPGSSGRYWQWFLHRRLANTDQVNEWCVRQDHTAEQFLESVRQAMIDM